MHWQVARPVWLLGMMSALAGHAKHASEKEDELFGFAYVGKYVLAWHGVHTVLDVAV